jgi:hypothetical protein
MSVKAAFPLKTGDLMFVGFDSLHPLHFISTLKNSDFVKPDTLKWAKLLTKLLTRSPVSGVF